MRNFSLTSTLFKVLKYPYFLLLMEGLNTNSGQIINIRLRPSQAPNTFYDMEMLMDTMLHELCHNIYSEHDNLFYGLLDQVQQEWKLLSSKGYQGEGFFSPGRRLGSGHVFYKPSIAVVADTADRRRIKDAAERREKGIIVRPEGRRLENEAPSPQQNGRRLGGEGGEIIHAIDPRELAAMAAEQRARDQKRCGAKQAKPDMKRETERARREGTTVQAQDIGNLIDLNDLKLYDLDDIPDAFSINAPSKSTLDGWICQQCTFQNPPLYLSCKICHLERTTDDSSDNYIDLTDEFAVSWDCQLCTFRNENVTDGKCMVCGTEI